MLLAALCATLILPGCKKKARNDASTPAPASASAAVDAGATARIPAPTAPDLDYEKRRAELLKRGDPALMPTNPVPDPNATPNTTPADLIKPVSKDVMMVGPIRVDLAKGTAEMPARVVAINAPLEYIAVTPWGKSYESMLTVMTNAVELRLALTLLGYEGTMPDAAGKVAAPTVADTVTASLRVDAKEKPIAWYLIDRRTKKPPVDVAWQVIGFRDRDRVDTLNSQELLTIVARDQRAPLRLTVDVGNVYAGPDEGIVADPKKAPAAGTEVTLVLARRPGAPPLQTPSPSVTGASK